MDASHDIAALPRPRAVMFDLDGTLVDTVDDRINAWLVALEEAGLPTTRRRLAPLIGIDGKLLVREIGALTGRVISDDDAATIDKRSGEIYQGINIAPRPLPGVREIVEAIESAGLLWAIATSSRREQVSASVRSLGLRSEPHIIDASHVRHAKPQPDLLLTAAMELRVEPARCWYVGDSTWDMVAAVAASMLPVGVTVGAAVSGEALVAAGAAAVAGDLLDIAQALRVSGPIKSRA